MLYTVVSHLQSAIGLHGIAAECKGYAQNSYAFNSAGKVGLQDKQITVTANTNPAQNRMHLIGEVTLTK